MTTEEWVARQLHKAPELTPEAWLAIARLLQPVPDQTDYSEQKPA